MITKRFGVDFLANERCCSPALTLSSDEVCENHNSQVGFFTRTHIDGWTISGVIHEDWYYWVNEFEATHPVFGRV